MHMIRHRHPAPGLDIFIHAPDRPGKTASGIKAIKNPSSLMTGNRHQIWPPNLTEPAGPQAMLSCQSHFSTVSFLEQ
ncbi:MAG: hypothetical protein WD397_11705 [Wenzhouxiangellaceae bacterium]